MVRMMKERMNKSTPVLLAAAATLSVSGASASACDLHGPGQFAGFHRYNPFASTMQNSAPAATAPKQSAKADKKAGGADPEVAAKEAKRRQAALEKAAERGADEGARADFFDKTDRSSIR